MGQCQLCWWREDGAKKKSQRGEAANSVRRPEVGPRQCGGRGRGAAGRGVLSLCSWQHLAPVDWDGQDQVADWSSCPFPVLGGSWGAAALLLGTL